MSHAVSSRGLGKSIQKLPLVDPSVEQGVQFYTDVLLLLLASSYKPLPNNPWRSGGEAI